MAIRRLNFGDSLAGLLIDGVDGTPYVGATLRVSEDLGVIVEVPYLSHPGVEQFAHVQQWFSSQSPPSNMLLLTPEGTISLFDISWSGHSENWGGTRASIGTLRPMDAVLGDRDGPLTDPLLMGELFSRLDGLNEWARDSAIDDDHETDSDNRVQAVTIRLSGRQLLTWTQGAATMSIRAGWFNSHEEDGYSRRRIIDDNVQIVSRFESGATPFLDHFREQRKVANLMVFLFGRQLPFREHQLRDDRFAARMMDGRVYDHPVTEVISRHTVRERRTGTPSKKDLGRPLAHLAQIGAEGLIAWADHYAAWERFILPSATALGRPGVYIEDIVISTSMSMEAAGGIIGERPGERVTWTGGGRARPTTASYVYRCLDVLGVQWPSRIADRVGLAKAVANNYNDVKHYDRGEFPDRAESYLTSEVNQLIVRLLAIHLTGRGDELLAPFRRGENLYRIEQAFESYAMTIGPDGAWDLDHGPSDDQ